MRTCVPVRFAVPTPPVVLLVCIISISLQFLQCKPFLRPQSAPAVTPSLSRVFRQACWQGVQRSWPGAGEYGEAALCALELAHACEESRAGGLDEGQQLRAAVEQRADALVQVFYSKVFLETTGMLSKDRCHRARQRGTHSM